MMRTLLLLAFVFSAMGISAQTARNTKASAAAQSESTQAFVHVDQFLSSLEAKGGNPAYVRNLLFGANPSTYVENNGVKTYGDNPVCVFTDVRSFASLASLSLPQTAEIITVKFRNASDFNTPLDFSVLSAFPRLKYVYLFSEVNVPASKIVAGVKNSDPRYSVIYNIQTLR